MAKYTVSTMVFDSLDEAVESVRSWANRDELRPGTKIFEIKQGWDTVPHKVTHIGMMECIPAPLPKKNAFTKILKTTLKGKKVKNEDEED